VSFSTGSQNASLRKMKVLSRKPTVAEMVEQPLEDIGGSRLVDQLGAARARQVGLDHPPRHRGGRQAFVPEGQRQVDLREQIMGKGADRLGAGPLAAVHVGREAEDEAAYAVPVDDGLELCGVGGELAAA
jgi:hypothetical protein